MSISPPEPLARSRRKGVLVITRANIAGPNSAAPSRTSPRLRTAQARLPSASEPTSVRAVGDQLSCISSGRSRRGRPPCSAGMCSGDSCTSILSSTSCTPRTERIAASARACSLASTAPDTVTRPSVTSTCSAPGCDTQRPRRDRTRSCRVWSSVSCGRNEARASATRPCARCRASRAVTRAPSSSRPRRLSSWSRSMARRLRPETGSA